MKALVAAFEPFGGESVNASLEALRLLPDEVKGMKLIKLELPTSFRRSTLLLKRTIDSEKPRLVLCVGQAEGRGALSLERIAVNVQDARIPDNDGRQPRDRPVVKRGPAAYFSTLPTRKALAKLRAAGLPAEISESAGTFVCNSVFYGLMHALAGRRPRAGFVHVPNVDILAPREAARGLALVLEASA